MSAIPIRQPLQAQNLAQAYGGRVLFNDLSLTLTPGRITVILGPNGAGKSTLLNQLAGLTKAQSGRVLLGDQDLSLWPARTRARHIGFLPQSGTIAWGVSVETLVGLGRTPYLSPFGTGPADQAAIECAIADCGLEPLRGRDVTTLSGGERARVLIARVLAGEPDWLLTDEPLTGLDPGHRLDVTALFRRFAQSGGGVVITLHDLDTALKIADRIIILGQGRILADGPPDQALTPEALAHAYGIQARIIQGADGPLVDIIGRVDA
jgi:iron complex transport system ATP-binding protein